MEPSQQEMHETFIDCAALASPIVTQQEVNHFCACATQYSSVCDRYIYIYIRSNSAARLRLQTLPLHAFVAHHFPDPETLLPTTGGTSKIVMLTHAQGRKYIS